jgi:hypothetical protein
MFVTHITIEHTLIVKGEINLVLVQFENAEGGG